MSRRHREILSFIAAIMTLLLPAVCPEAAARVASTRSIAEAIAPDSLTAQAWLNAHPAPDVAMATEILPTSDNQAETEERQTPQRIQAFTIPEYSAQTDSNRNWWHLAKHGYFNPHDTTVEYSKFMKLFCKVYNWGDRVFNTYDTTYVVGFGRNWKARLALDAWTDSYYMNFRHDMPVLFISEPYTSLGAYLHFMAVSVNYTIDLGKVMFNKPANHKKFEFGFNCARFNAELSFSSNNGGTYIRRFGDYKNKKSIREFFPGVKTNTMTAAIYYFFNNYKYANGAAYNFSKLQKKSAGSFILCFNYGFLNSEFDFTRLPEAMLPYLTWEETRYKFHYNEYCLLFGYGYNWVMNKHFLFNVTTMPAIGVTHCAEDSHDGGAHSLALNALGRMSVTYNMHDLFVCLIAKANIQWYHSGALTLFSGIENLSLSVGYRF